VDENMKTNPKERVLKIIVKSKKYRHTLVWINNVHERDTDFEREPSIYLGNYRFNDYE
jgi:hypothetical protein